MYSGTKPRGQGGSGAGLREEESREADALLLPEGEDRRPLALRVTGAAALCADSHSS